MPWTTRPDSENRCDGPLGYVRDEETVARLLHSKIEIPMSSAFSRKMLEMPKDGVFDDACGDADGCSVDRAESLDVSELCARADAIAALGEGRVGRGAVVARVGDLRAIPHASDPLERAVYIYDDPMANNAQHAVLRVSASVDRSEFQIVREQIIKAFALRVDRPMHAND